MAEQKMSREARNSFRKANNIRRKAERRIEAEKRNQEWSQKSKDDQIRALLARPGHAERQLRKLGFIKD